MKNYLLPILENYYEEILSIESKLLLSKSLINIGSEKIKEDPKERILFSAITSFRDISLIGADENLFLPDYSYQVYFSKLDEEVEKIMNERCCYAVAQSYEVIESYLVNILTEYFFYNQDQLIKLKSNAPSNALIKEEVREIIKNNKGINNKTLIHALRKISSHFREFELKNIFDVNITQWFDLISMIRHTLVHNRQIILTALLDYLNKQKANEMFDRHFKRKKLTITYAFILKVILLLI